MSNDRLRHAMADTGVAPEQLAELVEVDPKTIQRWLSGRTPYTRHRARIAAALGCHPHDLWPEADAPPPPPAAEASADLLAAYPRADDPEAPAWRTLLEAASEQIDLLDLTLAHLLPDDGGVEALAAKAGDSCRVRVLTSSPDSVHLLIAENENGTAFAPSEVPQLARDARDIQGLLQAQQTIEARRFVTAPHNTILRFDDEMLVALHLYGTPPGEAPLLHLRRQQDAGLFARFAAHFDAIWEHATLPGGT